MQENKLVDLSFEFAKNIVNLVDNIKVPKSSYMLDQLARAGTSVGANIHEAQYAHSKTDFIAKLEIALKKAALPTCGHFRQIEGAVVFDLSPQKSAVRVCFFLIF